MVTFMLCEFYFNKIKGKKDNHQTLPCPSPRCLCAAASMGTILSLHKLLQVLSPSSGAGSTVQPCPTIYWSLGKKSHTPGQFLVSLCPPSSSPHQPSAKQILDVVSGLATQFGEPSAK